MGLVWNWWAVPGLVAFLLAAAMAYLVYFAAPGGQTANRRLSIVLLLEGIAIGCGTSFMYFVNDMESARAFQAITIMCVLVLPFFHLYFLAVIDTPLVKFLRLRASEFLILAGAVGVLLWWFARPELFLAGMYQVTAGYAAWDGDWGIVYSRIRLFFSLPIYLFALAVSLAAYLQATTGIAQQRAKAYLIAFGIRDAFIVALTLAGHLPVLLGIPTIGTVLEYVAVIGFPIMMMVFIPTLALGILRTQLFDIDVKIRWTINKGTLASAFLLAFIVGAQTLEAILGERYGWMGGGVAMGVLLFVMNPLQKAAERLASRAMPGAVPVGELPVKERMRLFQEQLEYAWADGALNKKERMLLDHLRSRLGLEKREAAKLEQRITARFAILQGTAPRATH